MSFSFPFQAFGLPALPAQTPVELEIKSIQNLSNNLQQSLAGSIVASYCVYKMIIFHICSVHTPTGQESYHNFNDHPPSLALQRT